MTIQKKYNYFGHRSLCECRCIMIDIHSKIELATNKYGESKTRKEEKKANQLRGRMISSNLVNLLSEFV